MAPVSQGGYGLGDDAMSMRMMAIRDPLYLASRVMEKDLLGDPGPAHKRVAELILAQKSYLYLDHRGSFKTTLSDEVGSVHQFLRFPNDRILFMQASVDNAVALSKNVRDHFREGKAMRAIFPEYALDGETSMKSWSVPCKTRNTREGSLEIGTPGSNLSGRHYDVIAVSDVSNEQTSPPPCGFGSIEMAIALRNWLATMDGLLESVVVNPRAHRRIDGTRWSEMDVYQYLLDNDVKGNLERVIYGVTLDEDGRFCSQVPGFTHEVLSEIRERATMSAALWAANYVNVPLKDQAAMRFMPEWFKPYDEAPEVMEVAITVDPAWTEQEKDPTADRSALVVSGVCPAGNLYILDTRAGRWSPADLLEVLYALIRTHDPRWVGIESGTQSISLIETFNNELHRNMPYVRFRKLHPKGKNKYVRAVPLHTHAQKYGIYVKEAEHAEFVQELLQFPGGRYKDYVDAAAYRAQDMVTPFHRKLESEGNSAHNPRGLETGQDVLDAIMGKNAARSRLPWDEILQGGRN